MYVTLCILEGGKEMKQLPYDSATVLCNEEREKW